MHGRVIGDAGTDRIPRAAIDEEAVAEGEQASVVIEADLDVVDLVARMAGADEVLVPVLDPFYRTADFARQERDQQVLRIDVPLDAEAAADVERDAADARFRHVEDVRGFAAQPVYDLASRPDAHAVGTRIVAADHAAALHRNRGVAVVIKAAAQAVRCRGQRGFSVAFFDGEVADQVGAVLLVQDGAFARQTGFRIDDRRQRLELDRDQFGRVFRQVAALGDDDGDRLADVAHLVIGQQRLLRVEKFVLDQRGPFLRQRQLRVGYRRQQFHQIGPGDRIHDARRGKRARKIDRTDARMGHLAAHEGRMQHAGQFEVGDVLAAPGEQPLIFAPQDRLADEAAVRLRHWPKLPHPVATASPPPRPAPP